MAGNEEEQECMNISFSGCGFLGIYHVGVASAIKEYAPNLYLTKVAGASAGAIAACGLISNMCLSQATSDVLKIVALARQHQLGPLHPSINLMNILRSGLMKNLPDDAHKMASGRLFISMTRVSDGKNVLVSQFDTKEELIQAMLCSSFIPLYGGTLPPTFRGVRYMDGGFSDNLPILNGNTVTVSPFSGESDICPQDRDSQSFLSFDLTNMNIRFTSRNFYRFSVALFPPHPEVMSSICRQGFEDTLRFLARHTLADAEAVERTLLRYILELKPVKWLRYMTIPWFLPVDIGFSIFKKFLAWLPSWRQDSMWMASQASDAVYSFWARETDEQKAKAANSRLTCEMAITDLTFSSNDQIDQQTLHLPREPQLPTPLLTTAATTNKSAAAPSISSRRSSMYGAADNQSICSTLTGGLQSGGQCTVTEMNFGFSVDLASSSDPVRQMADIVVRDDVTKRDVRALAVADLAENLEIEGLRKVTALNPEQNAASISSATTTGQNSPPLSVDNLLFQQQPENFDTYAAILNYTHKRDALMAYYYMDENNHVKVTKIFGCDKNSSNVISTPQQQPLTSRNAHLKPQYQKEQHEIVGVAKIQQNVVDNLQQENKVKLAAPGTIKSEKMVAVVPPFVQTGRQSQNVETAEDTNSSEIQSNTH